MAPLEKVVGLLVFLRGVLGKAVFGGGVFVVSLW